METLGREEWEKRVDIAATRYVESLHDEEATHISYTQVYPDMLIKITKVHYACTKENCNCVGYWHVDVNEYVDI